MRKRKYVYGILATIAMIASSIPYSNSSLIPEKLLNRINKIPDSAYVNVKNEDLLIDEVYVKLAHDGWSPQEIRRIMSEYIRKNKTALKGSNELGRYAKQWLPTYGYAPGGDTIYQFVDTTYNKKLLQNTRALVGASFDEYYKAEPYTVDDRKAKIRQPGVFRPVLHKPSSGRILWIHVHPENDDSLIVIPDGGGMFRTHDLGKHWDCITDRIPVREHRNTAIHSSIPVDPDDWNHIFAFMSNGNPVYETTDGGDTWHRIEGATHYGFKRGYCFRDADGNLKFIGAKQISASSYWKSELYISEDTCKSWTKVVVPEELKDVHPLDSNIKGCWFQQVEFDTKDRNRIYLPTSRSLFYFDDGAKSYVENGVKKYNLKKMNLRVFNQDSTALRSDTTVFPLAATSQGFLNVNPNNHNQLWFSAGIRNSNNTALYYSDNRGKSWITLSEPLAGIGSGKLYGNESPWGWLGGFGVNYNDPNWVYGCSMSSAISSNGGKDFKEYSWGNRLKALADDGLYYSVSNSRHNADNHCIVSHKSGRVFRGSDGGMLVKDKDINGHQWTNIGGNMGQMLYYRMQVNEFGDQMLIGNTQDIDIQTYRYGRWGTWRGYEGSTCFINPYSNTGYFSGSGGGGLNNVELSSWIPGITKADVCSGSWYLMRSDCSNDNTFYRIDDVGNNAINLSKDFGKAVRSFAITRAGGISKLYVSASDNKIYQSTDKGVTFTLVPNISGGKIAIDPNNDNILYVGRKGNVTKYDLSTNASEIVGEGLPSADCSDFIFHEGSGDLYFLAKNVGIFIKENGSNNWRLWMKGYNTTKCSNIVLNYTTQEMNICDYGRGVFIADLQHPSDRYFSNGFSLKELSNIDGRKTIGIDTKWTIPLYYNYAWKVNGKDIDNPYQYLTSTLNVGDKVSLTLTLREAPDVNTTSAEYTVTETSITTSDKVAGNALYSDGKGMIDLGYVDYFFKDFSLDVWVKPEATGVMLCNRQKSWDKGAKGWYLSWENGTIYFGYAPANMFNIPTYEKSFTQQTRVSGGSVAQGKWAHVVVSQQQNGNLAIYVNGKKKGEAQRILPEHNLNNSMNLVAFSDGMDRDLSTGALDELKIWNYSFTENDVHKAMFSHESDNNNGLVYYNGFNQSKPTDNAETFSKVAPVIRTNATPSMITNYVAVAASTVESKEVVESATFEIGNEQVTIKANANHNVTLYSYKSSELTKSKSNLSELYHDVHPIAFQLNSFGAITPNDTISLSFKIDDKQTAATHRVYVGDALSERTEWTNIGDLSYDEESQIWTISGVTASDIDSRIMIIVAMKPSFELSIDNEPTNPHIDVFDANESTYPISGKILCNLSEPFESYKLISNNPDLVQTSELTFKNGLANGELKIDPKYLGNFGDSKTIVLSGEDSKMIPMTVTINNRILPQDAGNSIELENGGMIIGGAANYAALNNSNTVSMMGWVRIDKSSILSGLNPLIFFRGNNTANGIHITNGNIRCHWNNESWSWGTSTSLNIKSSDIGRWMHIALVARPNGMDYYLNGVKYTSNRTINKSKFDSPLMLGHNNSTDTWFNGAFDQVAVWNRSLTQEEVIKYMHSSVRLNDSDLVAYCNMDYLNSNDVILENVSNNITSNTGNIDKKHRSPIPFNPSIVETESTENKELADITFPANKAVKYYLQSYSKLPYNYMSAENTEYRPIRNKYYTLFYPSVNNFASTDSISLNIKEYAVMATDKLALGIRPSGSEQPFETYIKPSSVADGVANFTIAAGEIASASELMLFVTNDSGDRPTKGVITTKKNSKHILLEEKENSIPINIDMLSYNDNDKVILNVTESNYASVDSTNVELSSNSKHNILIDRSKLRKFEWNPVTVYLNGASCEPLELLVGLEPKVKLSLKNGVDNNRFIATQTISSLEVGVELIEGIVEKPITLSTTSELDNNVNSGIGSLLSNRDVESIKLRHFDSSKGTQNEGWNLIGNPFLTNINLTKHQNVSFDREEVAPFVYRYDTATKNYFANDMTMYDAENSIKPFEPFFIKSLVDNSTITISPVAKEKKLSRKTLDYYNASEVKRVKLELLSNGTLSDVCEVKYIDGASNEYVEGEDAPKLWSEDSTVNQIFSLAGNVETTINSVSPMQIFTPIGIKTTNAQSYSFRVKDITKSDGVNDYLILYDNKTEAKLRMYAGITYNFTVSETGNLNDRFSIVQRRLVTSNAQNEGHSYKVTVEGNECHIFDLLGNATIKIYDISGREQFNTHTSESSAKAFLQQGAYIVNIYENGKHYATKIQVK